MTETEHRVSQLIYYCFPKAMTATEWVEQGNFFDPQGLFIVSEDDKNSLLAFEMTARIFGRSVIAYWRSRSEFGGQVIEAQFGGWAVADAVSFHSKLPEKITPEVIRKWSGAYPALDDMLAEAAPSRKAMRKRRSGSGEVVRNPNRQAGC